MLDFIYTCRTCTDQRCIDPCAYDSIRFDEHAREVIINESTCTGCTACAQACPYGAIDMVEVENDAPTFKRDFKARLDKRDALKFGPGTGRIARARRIANKCDHCIAYGDQACVSACPTGSLIEVNPYNLFRERSPRMAQLARTGYDDDLTNRDRREVLPVMPFTEGLAVRSGGMAKVKRGRYAPLLLWMIGIFTFLIALGEVLLRLYAPTMSYQMMQVRADPNTDTAGPTELIASNAYSSSRRGVRLLHDSGEPNEWTCIPGRIRRTSRPRWRAGPFDPRRWPSDSVSSAGPVAVLCGGGGWPGC
jgi:Fe-S-cluster-containing hydrogenase component 2